MRRLLLLVTIALAVGGSARADEPDPGFDAWGGWRGITTTATGRFRIERIDGVWWLITPDGHGFFSVGVDHLRPGGDLSPPLGTAPVPRQHPRPLRQRGRLGGATLPRLADLGVNTIGAFSQPECFPRPIAYTVRLALAEPRAGRARACRRRSWRASRATTSTPPSQRASPRRSPSVAVRAPPTRGASASSPTTSSRSARASRRCCRISTRICSCRPARRASRRCRRSSTLATAATSPRSTPCGDSPLASFDDLQIARPRWRPRRRARPCRPPARAAQIADRRAFDAYVAERFHRVTHDALRAFAPDLLILGSRLLILSTRPEVLAAIAPYVDVVTVNYYEIAASDPRRSRPTIPADYGIPFARMFDDLDTMYRIAGKPFLIGEFSYRAADAGLPNTLPPFFPTLATQADRAQALGTYLRRVMARPVSRRRALVPVHGSAGHRPLRRREPELRPGDDHRRPLARGDRSAAAVTATAAPRRALAPGRGRARGRRLHGRVGQHRAAARRADPPSPRPLRLPSTATRRATPTTSPGSARSSSRPAWRWRTTASRAVRRRSPRAPACPCVARRRLRDSPARWTPASASCWRPRRPPRARAAPRSAR